MISGLNLYFFGLLNLRSLLFSHNAGDMIFFFFFLDWAREDDEDGTCRVNSTNFYWEYLTPGLLSEPHIYIIL